MSKEYADLVRMRVAKLEGGVVMAVKAPETGLEPIMDLVKRAQTLDTPFVLPVLAALADDQQPNPVTNWGSLEQVVTSLDKKAA